MGVNYSMNAHESLSENEPSVFPDAGFEKHISDKSLEYGATTQQEKSLHDGLSELRLFDSANQLACRLIVDKSREKILVEEAFGRNGKIWRRWAGNIEESFDENGNILQKTVFGDDERTIQRFRENVYGAEGIPAVEMFSGAVKVEETWYEGVREPGKPVKYGVKNRRAVKESGVWKFKPTRLVFDETAKKFKAYMYLDDALTDAPDGTPAFQEWCADKPDDRSVVRIKDGMLHGAPAITGRDGGISYSINAENGRVSDIPTVPGIVIQKDNLTLNVRFSADGTVQSKDVVVDLRDAQVELNESEIDELAKLLGNHLEAMVTRRYAKQETQQGTDPNSVVLKDEFY